MKLLFKQKFTFGFDKYEIFNEQGESVFFVQGRFAFGRKLEIFDRGGNLVGRLIGKVFTFLPTFEMYIGERYVGSIQKKMTFFKPEFILEHNGWEVKGSFWEYNYSIIDSQGIEVARLEREFTFMDTYSLDIYDDTNALAVLMIVLAIDAEKDNRNN